MKKILLKVKFAENHRCFKQKDEFEFLEGLTVMVGEQGVGKSTLLELISQGKQNDIIKIKATNPIELKYLDFERYNPRMRPEPTPENISSNFISHGESVNFLLGLLDTDHANGSLFLLDEPDMALSIGSIGKLINLINKVVKKRNVHIIMSVHNPFLIQAWDKVYDIKQKTMVSSVDYINQKMVKFKRAFKKINFKK